MASVAVGTTTTRHTAVAVQTLEGAIGVKGLPWPQRSYPSWRGCISRTCRSCRLGRRSLDLPLLDLWRKGSYQEQNWKGIPSVMPLSGRAYCSSGCHPRQTHCTDSQAIHWVALYHPYLIQGLSNQNQTDGTHS